MNIPDSRMTLLEIPEDKFLEAVAAHTVRLAVPNHSDNEDLPIIVHDNVVCPVSMSEAENKHDDECSWTLKVVHKELHKQCTTRDEPPKDRKGKGPDPKDWGMLSMSEDKLNPEAQQAMLMSWKAMLVSWKAMQRLARDSNDGQVGPSKSKFQEEIVEPDKGNCQHLTIVHAEHHKKEK
ncbi:hypothetical protein EDC04DRAFT_2612076 [Pisolithus marmoratus]|nr:hypothetical protein EDC04DRAFT_2612076 [Pisolithus marmoratus]